MIKINYIIATAADLQALKKDIANGRNSIRKITIYKNHINIITEV